MRVGLSTTAFFGDLGGYVFENLRYGKQYYMTICYRPVTDCKMNDLEWILHVKGQHFLNQSV